MSLPADQRLISADDHMDIHVLPPDLWQSRLAKGLRDRGPRVVETDDGPWWECEGRRVSPSGRKQAGFLNADQHGFPAGAGRDASGVPYVIERMDHEHEKYYEKTTDHRLEMKPSEIFRRQVYVTYEDEDLGVRLIPEIGADHVMWASDYPHGDSTWPHSHQALADSPLAALGPETLRKVTCDNAARVYGIA